MITFYGVSVNPVELFLKPHPLRVSLQLQCVYPVRTIEVSKWCYCVNKRLKSWWRYQMETFSAWLALWEGHPWFRLTKACNTDLWYFLWCALEQTAEQTVEMPVFETPWRPLWRHCNDQWWIWVTLKCQKASLYSNGTYPVRTSAKITPLINALEQHNKICEWTVKIQAHWRISNHR